ncbi:MAG: hypothetical protein N3D12_01090 [Candidatus Methanomethyliaceae archaeon]|nr:hypothetical protein [Candidatus Methanomethyliaceae archaeon]
MKGLAPLISIVLMILLSITGSTVTYVFINEFAGDLTSNSQTIIPIMLVEFVKARDYDVAEIYIRNLGASTVNVDSVYLLSLDGVVVDRYALPSPTPIPSGQFAKLAVKPWSLMAPKNGNYYVKVTTLEGGLGFSDKFYLKKLYLGDWVEYSANPVLDPAIRAYYPCVIYDSNSFSGHGESAKYKMWFNSYSDKYTIWLAHSNDGINWIVGNSFVSGLASSAGHPWVLHFPDGFLGKNSGNNPSGTTMYYRIWYWDASKLYTVEAIRYAESPDGVNWYNDQPLQNGAVPIITGIYPDWNRGSYGPACVLYNPSAKNSGTDWTFMMYYDGTSGGNESLGVCFSSDGVIWNGYDQNGDGKADPVLTGSGSGWDAQYVYPCTVLKIGSQYHMLYSGGVSGTNEGIGYAISSDGLTWTKDPNNPVFHKSDGISWRKNRTYTPAVVEVDGTFKMWFTGVSAENYAIGYATPK